MKKVLVTLVLVMTLGVSVSFAQAAPVEVPVVEKPQQSKKLVFSEIYMNDVPEAVMDRLASNTDFCTAAPPLTQCAALKRSAVSSCIIRTRFGQSVL